jgi:hypothetical protein
VVVKIISQNRINIRTKTIIINLILKEVAAEEKEGVPRSVTMPNEEELDEGVCLVFKKNNNK